MVRLKKYIKKLIMGKFYEDLDTLKENPQKSVSDIIKDTKKGKV